jgi:hypothetical protein
MLRGAAANIDVIVFGLPRPGLEPTIYHTRDEHGKHCTTDEVKKESNVY